MKFNYVKLAKQRGCSDCNFAECFKMKYSEGRHHYMAAHWLAWYYEFKWQGDQNFAVRSLQNFLDEIAEICREK